MTNKTIFFKSGRPRDAWTLIWLKACIGVLEQHSDHSVNTMTTESERFLLSVEVATKESVMSLLHKLITANKSPYNYMTVL